jgi:type I restriction enzyme M protein
VVIKNTFLSNSDNASKALREELLSSCNLHTILDCPSGTFIGAGVKTVVLFFEKRERFDSAPFDSAPFDSAQGTGRGELLRFGIINSIRSGIWVRLIR